MSLDIGEHIAQHAALGISKSGLARTAPVNIAYIGDSITAMGMGMAFFPATPTGGWLQEIGSRSWSMVVTPSANAYFEFRVSDNKIRYKAPNDSGFGAWVAVHAGLNMLQSATAGLEMLVGIKMDLLPVIDTAITTAITATSGISNYCISYANWAQVLSGHCFTKVSQQGVAGDSLAHILERLDDLFVYDSYLSAISATPNIVVIEGGTNDVYLYQRAEQDIKDDIDTITAAIKARGATPLWMTITARNSAPGADFTKHQAINRYILAKAADTNVIVVDAFKASRDPAVTTGAAITSYLIDNAHLTNLGGYAVGKALASKLAYLNRGEKGRAKSQYGGDDSNYATNNRFNGTGGTAGTGASGTIPTSWTVNRSGSALTAVASIVAVNNELPWLQLVCSGAAAGDAVQALITSGVNTAANAIEAGHAAFADIEFDVSGATGLRRVELFLDCYDGVSAHKYLMANRIYGSTESANSLPDAALDGVLRTPIDGAVIPAGTTNVKLYFQAIFSASGGGTVKIRAPGLFRG